jgi:hypothetical protein
MTFRFCDIKKKYFEGNKYFFLIIYYTHKSTLWTRERIFLILKYILNISCKHCSLRALILNINNEGNFLLKIA